MTHIEKSGRVGTVRPFDERGVRRFSDGALCYVELEPNLVEMLGRACRDFDSREAVVDVDLGDRLTYAELWNTARRVAGGLRAAGVSRGDRVAVSLPNGVPWIVTFFGVVLAGAIVVPINRRLTESETNHVLGDSGATVHIVEAKDVPIGEPWHADDIEPDEVAAIFYTSGTTGLPKGAMTTHRNFMSIIETVRRLSSFDAAEELRSLISIPLFHVTACNAQLLPVLSMGGSSLVLPGFDHDAYLSSLETFRPNLLVAVPAIYALLVGDPRFGVAAGGSVRRLQYGGAPMAPELIARLRQLLPEARLGNGYGLTETSSVSTRLPHELCATRPETVGLATPIVELDLLEPDIAGVGELVIRGANVVAGYWRQPEASAAAIVDGWLRTGDMASIDAEGFVTLLDRRKDMINRGGENVYSVEVENALQMHPSVLETAVLAVPDDVMGERVGAVVVCRPGQSVDERALLETASSILARFKLPEYFCIRPTPLPRNPGGKVLKRSLTDVDWRGPVRLASSGGSSRPDRRSHG